MTQKLNWLFDLASIQVKFVLPKHRVDQVSWILCWYYNFCDTFLIYCFCILVTVLLSVSY